ncbi:MAG: tRNA pseudouridine(55) synthase TruB [Armatimonadetes bacterium]|nr:tRNA pseudouridine(55) synthase TruB [Armatimonadota bacterium]MBS1727219.1 tRNA pseudouridine(55) synthase TruB [Armatimonadota bacterium]
MFGIVLIDKPLEYSSHDVVAKLRRKFNTKRIGHAGTLDPMATGLLVVAVGPATRFLQYLPLEPKVYRATVRFGIATDSYDSEGEIVREGPVPMDLAAQIRDVVPGFLGLQEQMPPMFSAVKVKGQPLYKYAREGIEIERKARTIHIERMDVLAIGETTVELEIECSGGTYVRTIANDLGERIGCGAFLQSLVRTQVGQFKLEAASTLDGVTMDDMISLRTALRPMPVRSLSDFETMRVRNGGSVPNLIDAKEGFVALAEPNGAVISVAAVMGNELKPECVIPTEALHASL